MPRCTFRFYVFPGARTPPLCHPGVPLSSSLVTPVSVCRHPGAGRDPLRRRHPFVTPRLDRGAQVIRSRRAATQIHCATVTHAPTAHATASRGTRLGRCPTCRNVALTCAYAVFQNDPELCGSNNNTCLENISAMFYQSLLCPDNSVYDPNAPDNASTASGYVNGKCKCIDGFTPANGQCLEQCQEVGQIRNASGVCQCDTANGWILSGDNCVCSSAMGFIAFQETNECVSSQTACSARRSQDSCIGTGSPGYEKCGWGGNVCLDIDATCASRPNKEACEALKNSSGGTSSVPCVWAAELNSCVEHGDELDSCDIKWRQRAEETCLYGTGKCTWTDGDKCIPRTDPCTQYTLESQCNAHKCMWGGSSCRSYTDFGCERFTSICEKYAQQYCKNVNGKCVSAFCDQFTTKTQCQQEYGCVWEDGKCFVPA